LPTDLHNIIYDQQVTILVTILVTTIKPSSDISLLYPQYTRNIAF